MWTYWYCKNVKVLFRELIMLRVVCALIATTVCCSFAQEPLPTSEAEKFLHEGRFADGEVALLLSLDANPKDDNIRFGLAVVQLMRTVVDLGKSLHDYGLTNKNSWATFTRLPVPKNENPSTINYRELNQMVDLFRVGLSKVEATLAEIKDENVKLHLRLSSIQFDFSGKPEERVKLIDILKVLNNGRAFDFQKKNPELRIHFDRGDVAWLRAYCHLLSAIAHCYLAPDQEIGFEQRMKGLFPRIESSDRGKVENWSQDVKIVDRSRLRMARLDLISVAQLNRETWRFIRAETDDDFEWLPNTKQTDQLSLPVTDRQIDAWLAALKEVEDLFKGECLLPGEILALVVYKKDYTGRGLNFKTLFDDPPVDFSYDRIQKEGIAEKYLEDLKNKRPVNVMMLIQAFELFNGPFGFARAARMN
jgi:hypothetical protein